MMGYRVILWLALPVAAYGVASRDGLGIQEPRREGELVRIVHQREVRSVAFSEDTQRLLSGCGERIRVTELFCDKSAKEIRLLGWDTSRFLRLPGSESIVLFHGVDNHLVTYDPEKEIETARIKDRDTVREMLSCSALAVTRDSKLLATAGGNTHVYLWDLTGKRLLQRISPNIGVIKSADFSPDGNLLALAAGLGKVRVWNVAEKRMAHEIDSGPASGSSALFSKDGKLLIVASANRPFALYDASSGQKLFESEATSSPRVMALSPDGHVLVTGDAGGMVSVWEIASGVLRARFKCNGAFISCIAISSDGRMAAAGAHNNVGNDDNKREKYAHVWDLTGRLEKGNLRACELSRDEFRREWRTLLSYDGEAAHRAIWTLTAAGDQLCVLLSESLHLIQARDPKALLQELDHPKFAVREKATELLGRLGKRVQPLLEKEHKTTESDEARRRLKALLEDLAYFTPSYSLRMRRIVEVLEQIGTAKAADLLLAIAQGSKGCDEAVHAEAALARLRAREKALGGVRPAEPDSKP
jgi:hypothetical protein